MTFELVQRNMQKNYLALQMTPEINSFLQCHFAGKSCLEICFRKHLHKLPAI